MTERRVPPKEPQAKFQHLLGRRRGFYLVINGMPRWVCQGEIAHILRAFCDPEDLVAWCPQGLKRGATHRKSNLRRILFLVIDLDNVPIPLEDLSEELGRRGFPKPWAIVETPQGGHVYWKLRPLRASRHTIEFYEITAGLVVEALRDLGADPQATDASHVFRLNATKLIASSDSKTSLGALYRTAKRLAPKTNLKTSKAQAVKTKTRGSVWGSPGIRWLREHVIPQGCRNSAVTALAIALFHDGHTEDEIREVLREWAAGHTVPTYPEREIRDTVKSLARRWKRGEPLGLLPERLLEIHDINGEHMPENAARLTAAALPKTVPDRKRLEQRQRKPRIAYLVDILREQPGKIPKTTRYRLNPVIQFVENLGTPRFGPKYLMCLEPKQILFQIAKAGLWPTEAHSANSIRFWARSEPEFWVELLCAVREFLSRVLGRRGKNSAVSAQPVVRPEEELFLMGSGVSLSLGRRECAIFTPGQSA